MVASHALTAPLTAAHSLAQCDERRASTPLTNQHVTRRCLASPSGGAGYHQLPGALTAAAGRPSLLPAIRQSNGPTKTASSGVVRATAASTPNFGRQMLVMVPPHPLVKHWIAILRNAASPPPMFRCALAELGRILVYEATRDWLPMISGEVQTPCGVAEVEAVDPSQPIVIIPVLRAGGVMTEQLGPVVPHTVTYHLGYARDEETLLPRAYLNKLPASISPSSKILLIDAMLATGGTVMAAMEEVTSRGANADNIRVVSAIAASPALKKLSEVYKGLRVYTGMIDADVNEKGFIVPGLGDAGDRSFGTW